MVSVIIPAYKASKYIEECLNSIKSSIPYEILIGIDGNCQETLNTINRLQFDIRAFIFSDIVGPYIIKNSLLKECRHENILFFDSDDILSPNTIEGFNEKITKFDYIKLGFVNFSKYVQNIPKNGHILYNAVIGIKKTILLKENGFYPWKCAADTELDDRLIGKGYTSSRLEGISYYRRIHDNNLTIKKETGHGSKIRQGYVNIINSNNKLKNWPSPKILNYANYTTTSL